MTTLGRLEKVNLRDVWENEPSHFTPWLAKEENIALLGDAIGLELEVEAQEENVGPFRADILCKDTANNNWVLIENQLERTDHCHLGQLLTYAAGLDAVTIVWIAERFTEEHRAAMDWLNEKTDEDVNFFGLEIELWKIGDSDIAPKFNIISKPNDWTRAVKKTADTSELSDKSKIRLEFWTEFKKYCVDSGSFLRIGKPGTSPWTNYALGKTGVYLASAFSFWSNERQTYEIGEIRAELVINMKGRADIYYQQLIAQKDSINRQLGFDLEWYEVENQISKGAVIRNTVDVADKTKWPEYYNWLKEHLEKMHIVFAPLVKELDISGLDENEAGE